MVELPVWKLGIVILLPTAAALLVRGPLETRLVESAPPIRRSAMQFRLDLGLYFSAAIAMALVLYFHFRFPFVQSGLKLVLGIVTVGFFAALDLALSRERIEIESSRSGRASYEPPKELSPLTRKFSLAATIVLLLITGIIMLVLIRDIYWLAEQDLDLTTIDMLGRSVLIEILFVMGFLLLMVINLVFSYARNLRILFDNETVVLEKVSRGDLTRRVPVATNDEMGVIAGHTNTMISALREGVRMREGLLIAQEIQQHLLPDVAPSIPGLDLTGTADFSDETGGDFYDFIDCEQSGCDRVAVVVGDVSGHGVGAALLMAAGRALVRQCVSASGTTAVNIGRVNDQLARDIADTGRFLTLFFLILDPVSRKGYWVNAGHQPPLVYDPGTDEFTTLKGGDIPLGVEADWNFHEHPVDMPSPGQIMIIGTDGVWEAHNPAGEMFGNERLQDVVRANADGSAQEILDAVVKNVRAFSDKETQEDDVTLVVIKGVKE